MATQEEHIGMFKAFIEANGNSENVCNLYWKRVRTFLAKHPEAMELGKVSGRCVWYRRSARLVPSIRKWRYRL